MSTNVSFNLHGKYSSSHEGLSFVDDNRKIFVDKEKKQDSQLQIKSVSQQTGGSTPLLSWKNPPPFFFPFFSNFLEPSELLRCLRVCRNWNLDVKKTSNCKMQCKKLQLGFLCDVPTLPLIIEKILKSACPFWPGKTIKETHSLVCIPKTIASKNFFGFRTKKSLTLNSLFETIKIKGGFDYGYISDKISPTLGSKPVKESRWVLMTKEVLPHSKTMNYDQQKRLVESAGYEMPHALEAIVYMFFKYGGSVSYPYDDERLTYTICKEKMGGYPLIVGGSAPKRLVVSYCGFPNTNIGVIGLRNFNTKHPF